MPLIFDALAGAGRGASGGQAHQLGKAQVAEAQEQVKSRQMANKAAAVALAETLREAKQDEQMRAAWADGLAEVQAMQAAAAPDPNAPEAEVEAFYAGKDDPTQQSINKLRTMVQRVAKVNPQMAVALWAEQGAAIKQRALEGRLRKTQARGSQVMQGLSMLGAEGTLPETAVAEFQARVQEVLEALDADPQRLDDGMAALGKIQSAAIQAHLEAATRNEVGMQLKQLTGMLPPTQMWRGALAVAELAMGADPIKVRANLAQHVYGEEMPDPEREMARPGEFGKSPAWVQARINAEGTSDALKYLADLKITDKLGKTRSMTPEEIKAALPEWEPIFQRNVRARYNKWTPEVPAAKPLTNPPSPAGLKEVQTGAVPVSNVRGADPATARPKPSLRTSSRGRPEDRRVGQVPPGGVVRPGEKKTERPTAQTFKVEQRKPNQTPAAFLNYVKQRVAEGGGTAADVQKILEEHGLTPDDFKKGRK